MNMRRFCGASAVRRLRPPLLALSGTRFCITLPHIDTRSLDSAVLARGATQGAVPGTLLAVLTGGLWSFLPFLLLHSNSRLP